MPDRPAPQYRFRGQVAPSESVARPVSATRTASSGSDGPTSGTLDIFDVIDSWGGWWGISASDVDRAIKQLGDVDTLYVRLNSPGGEATEGVAIANLLRAQKASVRVTVYGLAASAASAVALAGDSVSMAPGSILMIHEAWDIALGDADDMRKTAAALDAVSDSYADLYAMKAGGTRDEWRTVMRGEKWYPAADAVAAKLADQVGLDPQLPANLPPVDEAEDDDEQVVVIDVEVNAAARAAARRFDLSMYRHAPAALAPRATAVPSHSTSTDTGSWDAAAQEKKLDSPMSLAMAKKMYAWYDSDAVDGSEIPKSGCKFPHHMVSDGTPGAASTKACQAGIAVLNGGRGGANIPDSDRQGVYNHLAKHLRDADIEPAPLDSATQTPAASADGSTETQERSVAVEFTDEQLNTMRQQLGLPEDADAAAFVAAQAEALAERAELPAADASDDAVKAAIAALEKDGKKIVSKVFLDTLKEGAEAGKAALARQRREDRDAAIAKAQSEGKIGRSEDTVKAWQAAWDRDPDATAKEIAELGVRFPVGPVKGHQGDPEAHAEVMSDAEAAAVATVFGVSKEALLNA